MDYKPATVIAEIAAGHLGDIDVAKDMIKQAYLAGADYAKFQKRNPTESTPTEMQDQPHPNPAFAYGDTYLKHREALELPIDQHMELKRYCDEIGIGYSTSVWDVTSAHEVILQIDPDFIKVPSACNNNKELMDVLFNEYDGNVHISTGMTTQEEKINLYSLIDKHSNRVVMYHCTSEYPCPFDNLYLMEIDEMFKELQSKGVDIGFSDHGKGIAADIAAYTLGATWIERHFTYDRTAMYTDAAASLEAPGLAKLCRDLKNVHKALQYKTEMSEAELFQRKKLKGV